MGFNPGGTPPERVKTSDRQHRRHASRSSHSIILCNSNRLNTQQQRPDPTSNDAHARLAALEQPLRLDEWLADPIPTADAQNLLDALNQQLHGRSRAQEIDRFDLGLRVLLCRHSLGQNLDLDLAALEKITENPTQSALFMLIRGQISASRKDASAPNLLQLGLNAAHHLLTNAGYRRWLVWLDAVRKIHPPSVPLTTPISIAALCTEAGVIAQLEAATAKPIRPGIDRSSDPYDTIG